MYASCVGFQKAYNKVQHDLLLDRWRHIGVSARVLAAIPFILLVQGCPPSPTCFGIFFDGLHDHALAWEPSASVKLRSGLWVSS